MASVIMPKMGDAMEEGTLLKWLKSAGEEVSEGDPIAEIETDKVTLEIEAPESGFLTNTLVDEGAVVPIGTEIATIGEEGDVGNAPAAPPAKAEPEPAAEPEPRPEPGSTPEPVAAEAPASTQTAVTSPAPPRPGAAAQVVDRPPGERLRASPLVKRLAEEHGIDLSQVAGTGPGGRIVKNDINDFVTGARPVPSAQPGAAAATNGKSDTGAVADGATPVPSTRGTKVELARIRRTTGKRMAEAKATIPHYYVTSLVEMSAAMAFRAEVNGQLSEGGTKVSVNDLIVKAAALALRDNPDVNTSFTGGDLYQHDQIDVNIAIAIDGGLIAPFVPAADDKSLGAISRITKDLGRRAREGGLSPEEYQGGTFTISNLGMFDVDEFIAVINPPQAAILAVGSVQAMPVVKDGEIVAGNQMKLTLSADHRVLDGAQVAKFLQSIKQYLQNPLLLALA